MNKVHLFAYFCFLMDGDAFFKKPKCIFFLKNQLLVSIFFLFDCILNRELI